MRSTASFLLWRIDNSAKMTLTEVDKIKKWWYFRYALRNISFKIWTMLHRGYDTDDTPLVTSGYLDAIIYTFRKIGHWAQSMTTPKKTRTANKPGARIANTWGSSPRPTNLSNSQMSFVSKVVNNSHRRYASFYGWGHSHCCYNLSSCNISWFRTLNLQQTSPIKNENNRIGAVYCPPEL